MPYEPPSYTPPPYGEPPAPYPGSGPPAPAGRPGDVWRGIGLAFLLHLSQIPLGVISYGISLILIGLSQLLYLIPAIIVYSQKGRSGMVKGLLIGGGITFLLNAACTGLFILLISGANFH